MKCYYFPASSFIPLVNDSLIIYTVISTMTAKAGSIKSDILTWVCCVFSALFYVIQISVTFVIQKNSHTCAKKKMRSDNCNAISKVWFLTTNVKFNIAALWACVFLSCMCSAFKNEQNAHFRARFQACCSVATRYKRMYQLEATWYEMWKRC